MLTASSTTLLRAAAGSTIAPPTLAQLVTAMSGHDSTNGWDIVTSYSVDVLNAVLAKLHASSKLVTEIQESMDYSDPFTGDKYKASFDISLGAPTLQFVTGASGTTIVTMPVVKGSYTFTPESGGQPKSGPIPSNYSIQVIVPLAAVIGDQAPVTAGHPIAFNPGTPGAASIILHFNTASSSGSEYSITPPPPPPDQSLLALMLSLIENYFRTQVNDIDYALTSVSNVPGGGTVILPNSFVFASYTGVLSLFIQTTNSGFPQGNPDPAFQPGGTEILPVPQGYSASLIFSRAFIQKVYLQPGLQKIGTASFPDAPQGLAIQFFWNHPAITYNAGHRGTSQLRIDTLNIDFAKVPYHILLAASNATISWSFFQNLSWATDDIDLETGDDIHEDGTTGMAVTLNPYPIPLTVAAGNDIIIDLNVPNDKYSVVASGKSGWWTSGTGIQGELTGYVRNNMPGGLALNFGGLNYFIVANLLFPDSQVFKVDAAVGANVPRDLVLVGNISA